MTAHQIADVQARRWRIVPSISARRTEWLAYLLVFTMLLRVPGFALVSIGQVLALPVLAVLWLQGRALVRPLVAATLIAVVSALALLTWNSTGSELEWNRLSTLEVLAWPVLVVAGAAGLAWGITRVGFSRAAAILALTGLVDFVVVIRNWSEPWKFGVGQFVTLLVLVLLWDRRRLLVTVAMVPLVAISVLTTARSLALVQLGALVVSFVLWRRERTPTRRFIGEFAVLAVALAAAALAITPAAETGLLGSAIQARFQQNTAGGESVVLGARTEWVAAGELAQTHPLGYGPGAQPSGSDKQAVFDRVAQLYDSGPDYYSKEVFQDRVDLHSGVLNAWFHLGPGGVLWAACIALVLVLGLIAIPLRLGGQIVSAYILLLAGWHFVYSPLLDSTKVSMGLGVALFLVWTRSRTSSTKPGQSMPPSRLSSHDGAFRTS